MVWEDTHEGDRVYHEDGHELVNRPFVGKVRKGGRSRKSRRRSHSGGSRSRRRSLSRGGHSRRRSTSRKKRKINDYIKATMKARRENADCFTYKGKKYKAKKLPTGMVVFRRA